MAWKVPFVDPKTHYRNLKSEIDAAITECLSKGDLICRQQLREFEEHLASFVGVKYAVGVNSGYHALHFSLLAAGIGPGDEVITVGHTFVATVSAIIHCGAKPVLVDVKDDFNMDPDEVERVITSRTRALLPVHLNGRVCEMGRIMEIADRHDLAVVEDACQSLSGSYRGKQAGSFGLAGCWSFYPFKILGGFGDGGAVTTNDAGIAQMITLLRYNGEDRETGEYHCHGQTALLDNVQAAVLDMKLRHLTEWIEHRRKIAALYNRGLEGIRGLKLPPYDGDGHFDSKLRHQHDRARPPAGAHEEGWRRNPYQLAEAHVASQGPRPRRSPPASNGTCLPRGALPAHERRDHAGAGRDHDAKRSELFLVSRLCARFG
jgi:dTDP-4-amino-4,6-dideoxygalactose transaminase